MTDWLDQVHVGDCRELMRRMYDDNVWVQCIVTSPPYWGLRDYGVKGQLGLEPTWQDHVEAMRDVFNGVKRLLYPEGTLWLNYGDSYYSPRVTAGIGENSQINGKGSHLAFRDAQRAQRSKVQQSNLASSHEAAANRRTGQMGLKPKDLVGMPWRVALALQEEGWYLRSDIIWHKPNPMPESVSDRPTKAHEYLFLLTRSERYLYDGDAIRETASEGTHKRLAQNVEAQVGSVRANGGKKTNGNMKAVQRKRPSGWNDGPGDHRSLVGRFPRAKDNESMDSALKVMPIDRNSRSVWTFPTESFKGAHFATFPRALVRRCILAGSSPGDTIFDPFMGSGTVAEVAMSLGRHFIGCELNPEYAALLKSHRSQQRGMAL